MQLIEQLFGVSPDGGSGVLEFALASLVLCAAALRWHRARASDRRPTTPLLP